MADKSITELAQATSIYTSDLFVLSQSGIAKQLTGQTLRNGLLEWLDGHGGIKRIVKTGSTGTNPVVDTYTITYADDSTFAYTVTNGLKGDTAYWYVHIRYSDNQPTRNADMKTTPSNWMGVYSGSSSSAPTSYTSYQWYRIRGDTGVGISGIAQNADYSFTISMDDGTSYTTSPLKGEDAPYVTNVSTNQTMVPGTTRTWTMTFSDGTTQTFNVYDGANGDGAGDMTKAVYDTNNVGQDIFTYVDTAVAGRAALSHTHTMSQITDFTHDVVVEASVAAISGLSLTYTTVAGHMADGKIPIVVIGGNKIYIASYIASNNIYFIYQTYDGTLYYISLSNANAIASGSMALAKIASPAFSGTPTAPTAGNSTNSDQIATTGFVKNLIDANSGICGLNASGEIDPAKLYSKTVVITANTTLSTDHAGKTLLVGSDSNDITITIPAYSSGTSSAFATNAEIEIVRTGSKEVSFAVASGVTLRSVDSMHSISAQYASVGLKMISQNEWLLTGSLA